MLRMLRTVLVSAAALAALGAVAPSRADAVPNWSARAVALHRCLQDFGVEMGRLIGDLASSRSSQQS